ncbi:MAG TPA: LLM class flavin-dependent oxidoreductase [Dehalococcoidia bacterium]|nr:LLM class flavin-dependent oxidoreductase [Dehalococcoidia bacterium]
MITRFSTLYAGQVDLENTGFQGTPVNERWHDNDRLASPLETAEVMAKLMDRLGFDTLWMAEHHFQREGYECIPNILMLAVHLANRTQRLRLGCGFNIAPMWHPLRLAEDYAVADILTQGRVRFGVGRGYHTREVETFGAPMQDGEANRELFEEQVELVLKALREPSFSHQGKHYNIPPRVPYRGYELGEITLVPRPKHPVECWQPIVSASERGLEFMVRNGIKGFIGGGAATGGAKRAQVEDWQRRCSNHGVETRLGGNLILGFSFYIADNEAKAMKEATPLLQEYQKMFGPLGFVGPMTDEQLALLANPKRAHEAGLPTIEEAVKAGAWLCGPPELITGKLLELQDAYPGLEEVMVGQPVGTPRKVICEQLELFAQHVMPALKSKQPA